MRMTVAYAELSQSEYKQVVAIYTQSSHEHSNAIYEFKIFSIDMVETLRSVILKNGVV